MSWERGWSSAEKSIKWLPVIAPTPDFSSPDEKRRYEDALARNPRQPGDDVIEWIERVGAEARGHVIDMGRLPYREPGEEG